MELYSGTDPLIPLPELPLRYASGSSVSRGPGFRRFGTVEDDLRWDFTAPDRAALATRLLNACIIDPEGILPADFFRQLSIGKRIECLLVLTLGHGDGTLNFPFKCAACGEELEIEITLAELSELQRTADDVEVISIDLRGRRRDLRKLSGADQESLSAILFDDELDAATHIIARLAIEPDAVRDLQPGDIEIVEEAMEEADPLVNFRCRVECDECGEPNDHEIDLFETALDMLARAQRRLVLSVHRLALNYHWSEQEIFAVSEWRRRQYLELIGTKL